MEAWIEPQCGHVQTTAAKKASYMHSLEYDSLPEAVSFIILTIFITAEKITNAINVNRLLF